MRQLALPAAQCHGANGAARCSIKVGRLKGAKKGGRRCEMPVVHAVPSSRAGGVALRGAVGLGLGI